MMTSPGRISLACASFDDAPALARLLQCCCGLPHVDEFVVLDHRSRDDTRDLVASWQARYAEQRIPLRYEHEARDLSRHFTLADLLTRTFASCRNEIVCLLDSDFVIGDGFVPVLERAAALLRPTEDAPFAISFAVPLLEEGVRFDSRGVLEAHGRWRPHPPRPRIVQRGVIKCVLQENRFPMVERRDPALMADAFEIALPADSLVAVDTRSSERRRLRSTQTKYQRWAIETATDTPWLQAYEQGALNGLSYGWTPPAYLDDGCFVGQRFRIKGER